MNSADANNAIVAKHLENLANAAKNYTLAALASVDGSSSGNVLSTVASTVDGGLWYEMSDGVPILKLRKGDYEYNFNYDTLIYRGGNSNLVAYLPFDSSATDDALGNIWTETGTVTLDAAIKKFGNASAHTSPSTGYLSSENILDLGAERWTFDTWCYWVSGSGTDTLFALGGDTHTRAGGIQLFASSLGIAESSGSWATYNQVSLITSNNTWVHLAIVKNGNHILFFADGVKVYTFDTTGGWYYTNYFCIGNGLGRTPADAHFDRTRFFDGVALWTSDFTPPTAADYL